MQVIDKIPNLRASPSARSLSGSYGEKGNSYSQWPDAQSSFVPQCVKQENPSLDMGYDLNIKLNANETGDFRQSASLSETWNRFSSEDSYTLRPQFPSHKLSPSPDSSETATPPSVSGSLHTSALHDPLPPSYTINSNSPAIDGFASSYARADTDNFVRPLGLLREDTWSKNFGDYRAPPSCPPLGLGLNPVSLPPVNLSYDLAYSFPSHHHSSSDISGHHYTHHHHGFSGHLSPPPTASTSTSSGSSSPSLQGEFYDRGCSKPSYPLGPHLYPSVPSPSYHPKQYGYGSDWQACDTRSIAPVHNNNHHHHHHHNLPPLGNHSHSPSTSDSSGSADGKKPKIRPRRVDSNNGGYEMGLAKSMIIGPTPTVEMMYRVKKKVASTPPQPILGMGLEDIDENEIEFTSRQDTKPTRLLRRQCYNCKTWRDVSAWRRSVMAPGHIVCNKCGLYEKAHKRSRPLNDRGEFVRPGKDPNPKAPVLISPAVSKPVIKSRTRSASDTADGTNLMQFDPDEKDESIKDA